MHAANDSEAIPAVLRSALAEPHKHSERHHASFHLVSLAMTNAQLILPKYLKRLYKNFRFPTNNLYILAANAFSWKLVNVEILELLLVHFGNFCNYLVV